MRLYLPERLDGDGFALRPMSAGYAVDYAAAFREDPDLGRLLGIEQDPDEAAVRDRIDGAARRAEEGTSAEFAIVDPATDALWGEVVVHSVYEQHRRAELGFWVMPSQRRRGVGTRAVARVVAWLFDELDLLRVEMTTTPENQGVPAVARRLGFREEGVLRSRNVERGQRVDLVWFGLLREEWEGAA